MRDRHARERPVSERQLLDSRLGDLETTGGDGVRVALTRDAHHVGAVIDGRRAAAGLEGEPYEEAAAATHVQQMIVRARRERHEDRVEPGTMSAAALLVHRAPLLALVRAGGTAGAAVDEPGREGGGRPGENRGRQHRLREPRDELPLAPTVDGQDVIPAAQHDGDSPRLDAHLGPRAAGSPIDRLPLDHEPIGLDAQGAVGEGSAELLGDHVERRRRIESGRDLEADHERILGDSERMFG